MANNYVDNIKKKVSGLFFPFDIHDKRFPEISGSSQTTTVLTVKTDGTVDSVVTTETVTNANKIITQNDIKALDVTDTAVSSQYVSAVNETDGKISVTRASFSPSVTITAGTESDAPKVSVSVAGNSATAKELTKASTSVYGATKLSSVASTTEEGLAATPKGVSEAIKGLDVSDSAVNGKYVSTVSETDGKISVTRADFSPSITITGGDASNAPKVNVTVNTKSGTAQELTKATTSKYGATKLSSTTSTTEETLAATPKGVAEAIKELDVTDAAVAKQFVSAVSETDGKISVTRDTFSPSITITAGTSNAAPKVNVTVNGASGTAQSITTASTSVYGVTKLSSTVSNDSTTAVTPAAVADAISTNAANYISNNGQPFTSVQELNTYTAQHPGEITNNDYAIVTGIDSGNTYYDRYKATVSGSTVTWSKEYRINNSSFSTAQWDAINSGITSSAVTKLSGIAAGAEVNQNAFSNVAVGSSTISADAKQDTLAFEAGSHITLTADTANDKITIAFDDTIDGGTI